MELVRESVSCSRRCSQALVICCSTWRKLARRICFPAANRSRVERFKIWRDEYIQRPTTLPGHRLHEGHVDLVHIRRSSRSTLMLTKC